ncbi:Prolyl-tRNA editing protein ProX [Photobacterium malacitanum]|uniref:Prolyl-tRNA editing protein ProX n=1 Tax=Photobacterium malacitanum TaxID=2204294 RepID=A0A1Y6MAU5_9GAMM|nr:prolyl-tRNA synthetase associated domain-containing protein [Photobacterium malacitanum]SMY33664.1 Prolyl-tRNA editing protein ProX [Photobacterium malacitanum]
MNIYNILDELSIDYQRYDHPAVFNCEQAHLLDLNIDGVATKNLFIRDRKGSRHFLVVVIADKNVNLKSLSQQLGVTSLRFASPRRLDKYIGTIPGAVSILDIIKDHHHEVELVIDKSIFNYSSLQCHPFTNTATLDISIAGVQQLLAHYQRSYIEIDL